MTSDLCLGKTQRSRESPSPQGGSPVSGDAEGASRLVLWPLPDSSGPSRPIWKLPEGGSCKRSVAGSGPASAVLLAPARRVSLPPAKSLGKLLTWLCCHGGRSAAARPACLLPPALASTGRPCHAATIAPGQAASKGGAVAIRPKVVWGPGSRAAHRPLSVHWVSPSPARPSRPFLPVFLWVHVDLLQPQHGEAKGKGPADGRVLRFSAH